jgi:hypothetical protein
MNTAGSNEPRILHVDVTEELSTAQLADGRVISVPVAFAID